MTFDSTDDLLAAIVGFYDRVDTGFKQLQANTADARVELLASFLAGHASRLREQVEEWRRQGDAATLRAWFQYSPDLSDLDDLRSLAVDVTTSMDDVIDITCRLMNRLSDFCANVADHAQSAKAERFFVHLGEQARMERRRLMRIAQEIREM